MTRSTLWLAVSCLVLAAASIGTFLYAYNLPNEYSGAEVRGDLDVGLLREADDVDKGFSSASVLLWDTETQTIKYERQGFEKQPIASLTKLMTAMVLLDNGFDWEKEVEILPEEYVIGARLILHPGESVTMRDLFNISLLGSANNVTLALVRSSGIGDEEFVRQMNRKAIELDLEQATFVEVTGLDPDNVATAFEAAKLAEAAFQYPEIAEASSNPEYSFVIGGSGREHAIKNTNKLIARNGALATGSKTGFLYEAGYCLVMKGAGKREMLIAVVLGSESEDLNLGEMQRLFDEKGGK